MRAAWTARISLGVLLVGSLDFNFLGFYMNYNKEAKIKSLTFRRGSEVSQVPGPQLQGVESRGFEGLGISGLRFRVWRLGVNLGERVWGLGDWGFRV